MKLYRIVIFICVMTAMAGCGKKVLSDFDHPENTKKMEIVSAIPIDDMTGNNPMLNAGVYKDQIYFLTDKTDKMKLNFISFEDPKKQSGFFIPKGKGPGEVNSPMCISVSETKVLVFDGNLLKFLIFDRSGNFIEEAIMDPSQGIPFFHEQTPEGFVYSGMLRTRVGVGRIDEEYNIVVDNHVEYENVAENFEEMEKSGMRTAIPHYSDNEIFLSETSKAYTLSTYDMDLNHKRTYFSIPGEYISVGIATDNDYIYVPAAFDYRKAQKTGKIESLFRISLLDRKSGKHISNWTCGIKSVDGLISVLGVNNDYAAVLVMDDKNSVGKFLDKKDESSNYWLVIVK